MQEYLRQSHRKLLCSQRNQIRLQAGSHRQALRKQAHPDHPARPPSDILFEIRHDTYVSDRFYSKSIR